MGPVINATDVLLHANLGRRRSPAGAAAAAMLAARPDRPGRSRAPRTERTDPFR